MSCSGHTTPFTQNDSPSAKTQIIWLYEDTTENIALLDYHNYSLNTSSPSIYTEQLVLSQLDNYEIKLQKTSLKRLNTELKNSTNSCAANRIKTPERQEFSLFSTPQNIYLSHKLYRLAQKKPLPKEVLNEHGEIISLKNLFEYFPSKVLGTGDDASYGDFLDAEIAKLNDANVYVRGGGKRLSSLNEMLMKKRLDFLLFYPNDINLLTSNTIELESYSIAGSTPYMLGHFTCSKSEIGQQVINDINKILAKAYQSKNFYQVYQQWLLPADFKKLNNYFINEFGKKVIAANN